MGSFNFFTEDINRSNYSLNCLKIGLLTAAISHVFFARHLLAWVFWITNGDPLDAECGWAITCTIQLVFIVVNLNHTAQILSGALIGMVAGMIGLAFLVGSVQLDFFEDEDELDVHAPFKIVFMFYVGALGMCFVLLLAMENDLASWMIPIGPLLGMAILIVSIPASALILPITITFFVGGILCAFRAVVYWITVSKVRKPFQAGIADGQFDGDQMVNALGEPVRSDAHARALRKDVLKMNKEIEPKLRALREKKAKLSKSIKQDIARMEAETQLSKNMAEVEELEIQIATLEARNERSNFTDD